MSLLFRDLEADGSSWKDREISLWGNVVNDSVKPIEGEVHTYEFDMVMRG